MIRCRGSSPTVSSRRALKLVCPCIHDVKEAHSRFVHGRTGVSQRDFKPFQQSQLRPQQKQRMHGCTIDWPMAVWDGSLPSGRRFTPTPDRTKRRIQLAAGAESRTAPCHGVFFLEQHEFCVSECLENKGDPGTMCCEPPMCWCLSVPMVPRSLLAPRELLQLAAANGIGREVEACNSITHHECSNYIYVRTARIRKEPSF